MNFSFVSQHGWFVIKLFLTYFTVETFNFWSTIMYAFPVILQDCFARKLVSAYFTGELFTAVILVFGFCVMVIGVDIGINFFTVRSLKLLSQRFFMFSFLMPAPCILVRKNVEAILTANVFSSFYFFFSIHVVN